jgi:hypothetical protein
MSTSAQKQRSMAKTLDELCNVLTQQAQRKGQALSAAEAEKRARQIFASREHTTTVAIAIQQANERRRQAIEAEAARVATYRVWLARERKRGLSTMREQRMQRKQRHDAMLAWLHQYEAWRETNGRPIAYAHQSAA